MRLLVFLLVLLASPTLRGQYQFSGELSQNHSGQTVYLSLVENYRKSSRIYLDQIIKKAQVDSLGHFQFEGDNLPIKNRVYRIHMDGCTNEGEALHYLGECNNSQSVVFIANNQDTLYFPTSFDDQPLCTVTSTNPKSNLLLEVEALKEEMAYDFMGYPSATNQNLNTKKWFKTLHTFGQNSNEPLVELFIYDFLSDKRNETYTHYLKDVASNPYYTSLSKRLQTTYPDAGFTEEFVTEIAMDSQLGSADTSKFWPWKWVLLTLLILSLLANVYFLAARKMQMRKKTQSHYQQLTPQERKIAQGILQDKSNKEIATELFISLSTVKTHINNLYKKLGVSTREEISHLLKK
nr:helix-turn-helix transcriptional regulator [Allomuricauda sp.]